MAFRYRMQSLKTGWGVEAPPTCEGVRLLERMRRKEKQKFRWCRIFLVEQIEPTVVEYYKPFLLTHRQYC